MGVWSYLRQFLYTKYIIVVDDDINVRDWKDVMWAISTRTDPSRDMLIIEDTPIDTLTCFRKRRVRRQNGHRCHK